MLQPLLLAGAACCSMARLTWPAPLLLRGLQELDGQGLGELCSCGFCCRQRGWGLGPSAPCVHQILANRDERATQEQLKVRVAQEIAEL